MNTQFKINIKTAKIVAQLLHINTGYKYHTLIKDPYLERMLNFKPVYK